MIHTLILWIRTDHLGNTGLKNAAPPPAARPPALWPDLSSPSGERLNTSEDAGEPANTEDWHCDFLKIAAKVASLYAANTAARTR